MIQIFMAWKLVMDYIFKFYCQECRVTYVTNNHIWARLCCSDQWLHNRMLQNTLHLPQGLEEYIYIFFNSETCYRQKKCLSLFSPDCKFLFCLLSDVNGTITTAGFRGIFEETATEAESKSEEYREVMIYFNMLVLLFWLTKANGNYTGY